MIAIETNEPNGVIQRQSPEYLAGIYNDAVNKIRDAFAEVNRQEARIREAFGEDSYIRVETRHLRFDDPDDVLKDMERKAWSRVVNIAGVRRMMSVNKAKAMDEQLNHGQLPPLTAEAIRAFIADTKENAGQYIAEAVKEVHNWLRPTGDRYKTNSQFDVGEKVVLTGMVRPGYTPERFSMAYWGSATDRTRALDNVFAMLDGKPGVTTHQGWLADAISQAPFGAGETEYFRFRAFKNGNLHLQFKRMDLVDRLNAIAGGRNLYAA